MAEEFNLSDKIEELYKKANDAKFELADIFDMIEAQVKEFIRLLKKRIEELHDKQKENQEQTKDPEVALERLNKANLIFGNDGILEEIDKLAGEKLQ